MLKLSPRSCILKGKERPRGPSLRFSLKEVSGPELGIAVDVHQGSSRPRRIGDLAAQSGSKAQFQVSFFFPVASKDPMPRR